MNKKFNVIIAMIMICVFVLKANEISYAYNETKMAEDYLQYKLDFPEYIVNNELPKQNNEILDNNNNEEIDIATNYLQYKLNFINKIINDEVVVNEPTTIAEATKENISLEKLEIEITSQEVNNGYDNTIAYACSNIIDPYDGYITEYMDLSNRKDITVDHMRTLIERYTKNHPESKFIGTEQAFIDAANQTGLDPIFLFALAGHESGWYVSDLHGSKNNPYSINMTDENPSGGYHMGDSFYNGIINGAQWIKDNYYNNGYTTLYSMIYGGRRYASTTDQWIKDIKSIMNTCYKTIF